MRTRTSVIAALLATEAIAFAAPASADDAAFVAAMRAAGITGTDDAILATGRTVCRMLGSSAGQPGRRTPTMAWVAAEAWLRRQDPSLSEWQANTFVVDAAKLLCVTGS
jgi:Protein of unknown function (DUF732)